MSDKNSFKGKVKYNGNHYFANDWVEGSLIKKSSGTFIYVTENDIFGNILREVEVEVILETVCQCTGVIDTKKIDSFENDIIVDIFNQKAIIKYDKTSAMYILEFDDSDLGWEYMDVPFTIVGNIYDNH